jgi:hypothetical protein
MHGRRYGYRRYEERHDNGAFPLTRRDPYMRDADRDAISRDLQRTMRDAYAVIRGDTDRDPAKDAGDVFGSGRDLLGLLAGGGLTGLAVGLLGNTNLGQTGIPFALLPAAAGYAISAFGLAGDYGKDVRNAANGALVVGLGLWAASQGARLQQNAAAPATIVAGRPSSGDRSSDQVGNHPAYPTYTTPIMASPTYAPPAFAAPVQQAPVQQAPVRESALTEAELIDIARRY